MNSFSIRDAVSLILPIRSTLCPEFKVGSQINLYEPLTTLKNLFISVWSVYSVVVEFCSVNVQLNGKNYERSEFTIRGSMSPKCKKVHSPLFLNGFRIVVALLRQFVSPVVRLFTIVAALWRQFTAVASLFTEIVTPVVTQLLFGKHLPASFLIFPIRGTVSPEFVRGNQ